MLATKLEIGDTIGVIAPSNPIDENLIIHINNSITLVEKTGFKVKFGSNIFLNDLGYSASVQRKVEDLHQMFLDKEVKAIICATGGFNSNSLLDYIDYEIIKKNPKIICGFSDITSLLNGIYIKTGLVTFHGPNFKSLTSSETNYSYDEFLKRFVACDKKIGKEDDTYREVVKGQAEGVLVGGNLSLIKNFCIGKYKMDFTDKILFIEDLGHESPPGMISNYLYFMKQNGVFDKIRGIWVGNYEHESRISLEKILLDILNQEYDFPIIKSNNFGHTERKTVIPIGVKVRINTQEEKKIEVLEPYIDG